MQYKESYSKFMILYMLHVDTYDALRESCHRSVTIANVTGYHSNLKLYKDIDMNGTGTKVNVGNTKRRLLI